MAEPRPYYSDRSLSAAFYDLMTARDGTLDGDIEIYAGLTPAGGQVLELGAGTGRVALALAERGLSVVGVDMAPAMLEQAQAKRTLAPPEVAARVSFLRGDMTALNLGRTFDSIICPFFGLAHLPVGAAWSNTFGGIGRHLAPGGRAAVHLPAAELLAGLPDLDPSLPVMQVRLPSGEGFQLFVRSRGFRPRINRFDQVLEYQVTSPAGTVARRSRERQTYYVGDPAGFAGEAGLVADRPSIDLGGVGAIHVFRKP